MKHIGYILLFFCVFIASAARAQFKEPSKTEAQHIARIVETMRFQDSLAYSDLFLNADSIWQMVLKMPDTVEETARRRSMLISNPGIIRKYDPQYNPPVTSRFDSIMQKGELIGIYWDHVQLASYRLFEMRWNTDNYPYSIVSPVRYEGFVHIRDALTRQYYTFPVKEVHMINGRWYGGEILTIQKGGTVAEFYEALKAEKKNGPLLKDKDVILDSATIAKQDQMEDIKISRKEVVDRKYYRGMFDDDVEVQLYIRYIRGKCPGEICYWEGIFKFGDQDEWVKLNISRTPDGRWIMAEDPHTGTMDMKLEDKIYTGTWISSSDKTEYVAEFIETPANNKKLRALDKIIEEELWYKEDE